MVFGVYLGFIYTQSHGYTQTCTKHKDPQTRITPSFLNLADVQEIELLKLVMKGSAVRVRSEAPKKEAVGDYSPAALLLSFLHCLKVHRDTPLALERAAILVLCLHIHSTKSILLRTCDKQSYQYRNNFFKVLCLLNDSAIFGQWCIQR